jgi:glutaredoxin
VATMDGRRSTHGYRTVWSIGLGLLTLVAAGCDRFDPSIVVASSASPGAKVETVPAASGKPSPGMDSIGPEDAQRIYYQFIDDRGQVQFVERLSDVPKAWQDQVGYVEMSQPPPLTPKEARKTWRVSSDRAAEIKLAALTHGVGDARTQREDVILYSATWCGYCTKARAHLDSAGIRYELRDVDIDAIGRELREKTGRGGVPVLDFSGEILRGYSSDQYDRAIRSIRG